MKSQYKVKIVNNRDKSIVFQMYTNGSSISEIARHFEVSRRTIGRIIAEVKHVRGVQRPLESVAQPIGKKVVKQTLFTRIKNFFKGN